MVDPLEGSDFTADEAPAARVLTLVRGVASPDEWDRRRVALEVGEWWLDGRIDRSDGLLLSQLCLWAVLIEDQRDNLEDLLDSLHSFADAGLLNTPQAVVLVQALSGVELTVAEREDYLPTFHAVAGASPTPVRGRMVNARSAIDLLRGLASTDDEERLRAARMLTRVAPRLTVQTELRCFARVLLHAAVLEPGGSDTRHEQLEALRFLGRSVYAGEDVTRIGRSVRASGVRREIEAVSDL